MMQPLSQQQDRMTQLLNQQRQAYAMSPTTNMQETLFGLKHKFDYRTPTKEEIEEMLDTDTTFRWLHIPFVITELVWDRLDTVKDLSMMMDIPNTRKLNRQVAEIQRTVNSRKRCLIQGDCHNTQVEHGQQMIDEMEHELGVLYQHLYNAIGEEFPDLTNDARVFVSAVHEARIIHSAIKAYNAKLRTILREKFGLTTKDIMPTEFNELADVMTAFCPEYMLPPSNDTMKKCVHDMTQLMFDIRLYTNNDELERIIF